MKPSDYNLVVPGDTYRPLQTYAIDRACHTGRRFILIDAPPGSGKSLIGLTIAARLGARSITLTADKLLQKQYLNTAPDALLIMGRNEYPCYVDPSLTVDKAHCGVESGAPRGACPYKRTGDCIYYKLTGQLRKGVDRAILNYSYYLHLRFFTAMSNPSLLICDEADLVEAQLLDFVGVNIQRDTLRELDLPEIPYGADIRALRLWIAENIHSINMGLQESDNMSHEYILWDRLRRMTDIIEKTVEDEAWVLDQNPYAVRVKPLEVSQAELPGGHSPLDLLSDDGRMIFMSASILSPHIFCDTLGLELHDVEYISLPSTFPRENRPIVVEPVVRMTSKTKVDAWPKMVEALDEKLERYIGKRGLIHTASYALANYVKDHSRWGDYMILPGKRGRKDALEGHQARRGFLLSPSMTRGVDLHDDLCDVIIWLKIPYLDLGDPWVKARQRLNGRWYQYETVKAFIQGCGRGVRSDTDRCTVYVLDAMFDSMYKQTRHYIPDWFKEAIEWK